MSQEYPVYGDRLITVETSSGDIVVEGRDVQSIIVPDGDDIKVKDNDATLSVKSSRGGSRDMHIVVPSRSSLLIRSASGDITVRDVSGQVSAKTMSGQISAHSMGGRFDASSMSGDVVLLGSHVSDCKIDTVSGDSLAEMTLDNEGSYRLHSVSGNLTLRLPENQGCSVKGRSISGRLKCKLPYEGELNSRGHGNIEVNGGGPPVKMTTTSGSMRVRGAKDLEPVEHVAEDTPEPESMSPFEPMIDDPFADDEPVAETTGSRDTHRLDGLAGEPFGVTEDPAPSETPAERRMAILKQIEKGDMTVAEGLAKLRALD